VEIMHTRKLIGFGRNSFVISLPKEWVERNKLQKGQDVFLIEDTQGLRVVISPQGKPEEKRITINTEKKEYPFIRTEIITAYLNGNHVIEIRGAALSEPALAQKIRELIKDLTGLEIVDETSSKIVVRDLIDLNQVSLQKMVQRIDLIIRSMIEDTIQCQEACYMDNIMHRDKDVNRLVFLVFRLIKSCFADPKIASIFDIPKQKLITYWLVTMRLEKIGDQMKRVARSLCSIQSDESLNKREKDRLIFIMKNLQQDYHEVMKAFASGNMVEAYKIELNFKCHIEALDSLLENTHHYELARTIDQLKSTASSIKHIARNVGDNNG